MTTKSMENADFMATCPSLIKFLLKKDPVNVGDLRRARQFLSFTRYRVVFQGEVMSFSGVC